MLGRRPLSRFPTPRSFYLAQLSVELEKKEPKEVNELWLAYRLLCLPRCCRIIFR